MWRIVQFCAEHQWNCGFVNSFITFQFLQSSVKRVFKGIGAGCLLWDLISGNKRWKHSAYKQWVHFSSASLMHDSWGGGASSLQCWTVEILQSVVLSHTRQWTHTMQWTRTCASQRAGICFWGTQQEMSTFWPLSSQYKSRASAWVKRMKSYGARDGAASGVVRRRLSAVSAASAGAAAELPAAPACPLWGSAGTARASFLPCLEASRQHRNS